MIVKNAIFLRVTILTNHLHLVVKQLNRIRVINSFESLKFWVHKINLTYQIWVKAAGFTTETRQIKKKKKKELF